MPHEPSSASLCTESTGSTSARVGPPKGSRPGLPTVHRPNVNRWREAPSSARRVAEAVWVMVSSFCKNLQIAAKSSALNGGHSDTVDEMATPRFNGRETNRFKVLRALYAYPASTRTELAEYTGLSRP